MAYKKKESQNTAKEKAQEIFNHCQQTENKEKGYLKTVFVIDSKKDILLSIFEFEKSDTPTANVVLCDAFLIKPRIVDGQNGKFLSFPSYKNKDSEYINTSYCFDKEIMAIMNELVNMI